MRTRLKVQLPCNLFNAKRSRAEQVFGFFSKTFMNQMQSIFPALGLNDLREVFGRYKEQAGIFLHRFHFPEMLVDQFFVPGHQLKLSVRLPVRVLQALFTYPVHFVKEFKDQQPDNLQMEGASMADFIADLFINGFDRLQGFIRDPEYRGEIFIQANEVLQHILP